MPRALIVPFTKMSGAGNDFVVLDNRFLRFSDAELAALAAAVCPRRVGVGADGLLALDDADGEADFRMRYRNSDGSLATMCGNGARCLARFAARAGLGRDTGGDVLLAFDTDGGRYSARVMDGRSASGTVWARRAAAARPRPRRWLRGRSRDGTARCIRSSKSGPARSTSSPSWTRAAAVDLEAVGPRLRHDPAFAPAGTNVNVVEIAEAGHRGRVVADDAPRPRIVVRTFEKGVEGETLACGTGALASALAAYHTGRVHEPAMDVAMPGGTLRVRFTPGFDSVENLVLEGPAETVFEGTLEWNG